MGLQKKLNDFKTNVESGAPPFNVKKEAVEIMHRATDELRASGILKSVLRVGDKALDFSLPNTEGNTVRLKDLLAKGSLVLSFYRGVW
jgi:hypothetical protein